MSTYPSDVVDERGNVHVLGDLLGEGGQGVVFATDHPEIAVKLVSVGAQYKNLHKQQLLQKLTEGFGTGLARGSTEYSKLRARLESVRILPLPDLHLAYPLEILRSHVGYTMRLLRDMVPIRTLILPHRVEQAAEEYLSSGGLRRRLRLLARTAEILGRLHSVPLVYGDISPNNVFVSSKTSACETWLLDTDNLRFQSAPGPSVYTPGFGAPEIVAGYSAVSTLSDVYSFALLAFYVIAQIHPFLGNLVEEGGWEASVDMEEQAYAGKLPWVEDRDDDSNWSDSGIPREIVLTPRLRELFQQTFGDGRGAVIQRPGMLRWAEVLHQCADLTVKCQSCSSTYYAPVGQCPWCVDSPETECLYAEFRVWDPELDSEGYDGMLASPPVWRMCMDLDDCTAVCRHAAVSNLYRDGDSAVFSVKVKEHSIRILPETGCILHAVLPCEKRTVAIDSEKALPLPLPGREWYVHLGNPDKIHRVASFRMIRGNGS